MVEKINCPLGRIMDPDSLRIENEEYSIGKGNIGFSISFTWEWKESPIEVHPNEDCIRVCNSDVIIPKEKEREFLKEVWKTYGNLHLVVPYVEIGKPEGYDDFFVRYPLQSLENWTNKVKEILSKYNISPTGVYVNMERDKEFSLSLDKKIPPCSIDDILNSINMVRKECLEKTKEEEAGSIFVEIGKFTDYDNKEKDLILDFLISRDGLVLYGEFNPADEYRKSEYIKQRIYTEPPICEFVKEFSSIVKKYIR